MIVLGLVCAEKVLELSHKISQFIIEILKMLCPAGFPRGMVLVQRSVHPEVVLWAMHHSWASHSWGVSHLACDSWDGSTVDVTSIGAQRQTVARRQ